MSDNDKLEENEPRDENSEVSLVPLYSPLDVSKGLQAYRRGDVILYTVRGEPSKVQELIGELDGRGINDIVALVSHRVEEATTEEIADAVVENLDDDGDTQNS